MVHVVILLQRIRAGAGVSHRVMPTPACPERDVSGIVAFPVTRSSKLKKVCTIGFTRTRPRLPNWPHSKTLHFAIQIFQDRKSVV